MFAAIDSGTTNTRVYIVDQDKVIGRAYKKVGVRDTAITGSKETLKQGIKECFHVAMENAKATLGQVEFAIASGMISTEIGLLDIPHITAPAGLNELIKNVVVVKDTNVFPIDIPIIFIPGVKNNFGQIGVDGIRSIDFMRGEETQVVGIIDKMKPVLPCNILILSSHTKMIHVDTAGCITGSITTISGQIYEAIKKQTVIGKSIDDENPGFFSGEIIDIAYDSVQNAGFLRTLLMPRFMEVLLDTKGYERRLFVEAVIASDDIKILDEANHVLGIKKDMNYIFVGGRIRCKIYEKLLRQEGIRGSITSISDKEEIDEFAIRSDVLISRELIRTGIISGL